MDSKCRGLTSRSRMIEGLRSIPGVQVSYEVFDTNPWLLNVKNGTVDLRTGELRPHNPADMLMKQSPYNYVPDAQCPKWLGVLHTAMGGRSPEAAAEMVAYLQRVFGYAATGNTGEQCYFEFWGNGFNGKSTVVEIVGKVLGNDYTVNPRASLITAKSGESHPTEIANLFGKRMAMVSETDAGKHLNEALIKEMTGKTRLAGRRMREDFWEFSITHKLFVDTNHQLTIRSQDNGIWRRPRPVHFKATLPENCRNNYSFQDDILAEEGEGILAWLVEGALEWQKLGLADPLEVAEGVKRQREDSDAVGLFLGEMCEFVDGEWITKRRLHELYYEWMQAGGLAPKGIIEFGKEISGRGIETGTRQSQKAWLGLKESPAAKRPLTLPSGVEEAVKGAWDSEP